MTPTQIRALREELEVALLQAFSDFERMTGSSIVRIELAHSSYSTGTVLALYRHSASTLPAQCRLTHVTVQLEPL